MPKKILQNTALEKIMWKPKKKSYSIELTMDLELTDGEQHDDPLMTTQTWICVYVCKNQYEAVKYEEKSRKKGTNKKLA